jgi:hypothetical protein
MPEHHETQPNYLSALPLALLVLRQAMQFIAAERARTGKTTDEIFADAGLKLDINEAALLADLEKYNAL